MSRKSPHALAIRNALIVLRIKYIGCTERRLVRMRQMKIRQGRERMRNKGRELKWPGNEIKNTDRVVDDIALWNIPGCCRLKSSKCSRTRSSDANFKCRWYQSVEIFCVVVIVIICEKRVPQIEYSRYRALGGGDDDAVIVLDFEFAGKNDVLEEQNWYCMIHLVHLTCQRS